LWRAHYENSSFNVNSKRHAQTLPPPFPFPGGGGDALKTDTGIEYRTNHGKEQAFRAQNPGRGPLPEAPPGSPRTGGPNPLARKGGWRYRAAHGGRPITYRSPA